MKVTVERRKFTSTIEEVEVEVLDREIYFNDHSVLVSIIPMTRLEWGGNDEPWRYIVSYNSRDLEQRYYVDIHDIVKEVTPNKNLPYFQQVIEIIREPDHVKSFYEIDRAKFLTRLEEYRSHWKVSSFDNDN